MNENIFVKNLFFHLNIFSSHCFSSLYFWLLNNFERIRCIVKSLMILTKTRNNLKLPETIWNHLKPSETTWNQLKPAESSWNHPETTWKHLKPAILYYLFLQISYSKVEFVLTFNSKVFFGEIWSRKLKFSKLTEIWDRGILLYAYYDFNVYFFEMFVIHIFWATLVPKSQVLQIMWNLGQGYIGICLLWF